MSHTKKIAATYDYRDEAGTLATSRLSITRNLGPRIAADEHWPGMYRVRLSDGSLSDMTNLTRTRDALANHGTLNK